MLCGSKLTVALSKVKLIPVHGPWSRVVGYRHVLKAPGGAKGPPQPLWGGAARINGARFTPKGGFDSIYLAGEPVTALTEVQALVLVPGAALSLRTPPWALLAVDGIISNVLDLTDARTLKILVTTEQEMSGSWVKAKHPPTQELGQVAYDSGLISGIRYGSAKNPGGVNLVVFPDRLAPPSADYLEVFDPYRNLAQRLGCGSSPFADDCG